VSIIALFTKRAHMTSSAGSVQAKQCDKDYQDATRRELWYHIKGWSHQRPCWGAFCTLFASLLILWAPVCLLQSGIVPGSTLWAGLVIGGLLCAMGLVELFAPAQAQVAGAAGVVLSLVSLIAALGGFGMGMLLGVIGSSYAVAWRPESKTGMRPVFWSVLGCSMTLVIGMVILVSRGTLAVAAPLVGPYTTTTGRAECHNIHSTPAISQVDHRTLVELSHTEYCTSSNVVTTQHVLGRTIRITQASVTSRGITSETVAAHTSLEHSSDGTLTASNGLEGNIAETIETNVTAQILFGHAESTTISGISFSIS
jgi:uncharacterized protein DUF6114